MRLQLEQSHQREVNTDPQRRCYNGCHARSELQWSAWERLDSGLDRETADRRLEFWKDLNTYSVSVGGSPTKYRVVEAQP